MSGEPRPRQMRSTPAADGLASFLAGGPRSALLTRRGQSPIPVTLQQVPLPAHPNSPINTVWTAVAAEAQRHRSPDDVRQRLDHVRGWTRRAERAMRATLPAFARLDDATRVALTTRIGVFVACQRWPDTIDTSDDHRPGLADAVEALRADAWDHANANGDGVDDTDAYELVLAALGLYGTDIEMRFLLGMLRPHTTEAMLDRVMTTVEPAAGRENDGQHADEPGCCDICFVDLGTGAGQEPAARLLCGHVMGERCARRWLTNHNSCPFCRARLYWFGSSRRGAQEMVALFADGSHLSWPEW